MATSVAVSRNFAGTFAETFANISPCPSAISLHPQKIVEK